MKAMSILDKIPLLNRVSGKSSQKSAGSYYNIGEVNRGSFTEFLLGMSGRTSASDVMRFYRQSSAVAIAVDKIAKEIEQIRPVLLTEDGKYLTDHPVLDLINNPNGAENRDQFIGQVARHYLLTHDAFIYAEGTITRPPSNLWSTKPQSISILDNHSDNYPQSYNITTGPARGNYVRDESKRDWRYFNGNLRQVHQITGFSSYENNGLADSPLHAAALEVRQQILGRYHNLRLLENGGRLSLIAIFKDQLDESQLEARRAALNENWAGPRNAGKIAVVNSEDLDLKEVGTSNKDMDFATLDKVAGETIAKRYDIPLPLITNDASTFNNLEQSVFHFYDMAVLPTYQKIYNGLGKMLLPRYGLDPAKFKLTYNPDDIDALRMRRIEEETKLFKEGITTRNEARDKLSYEPVTGGDDILVPANLIPVAQDTFRVTDIDDPEVRAGEDDS